MVDNLENKTYEKAHKNTSNSMLFVKKFQIYFYMYIKRWWLISPTDLTILYVIYYRNKIQKS